MARDKGVSTGHRGVHRAGKHTKAGQAAAKAQPRLPKGDTPGLTGGGVYSSKKGLLSRLFGK